MAPRPPLQFDPDERLETVWKEKGLILLLSLMVFAGFLGLLGRGPLSHAFAPLPAIMGAVRYDHLERNNSGQISVEWKTSTAGGMTEINLDQGLLDAVQVTSTTPTASAYRITSDGAAWIFATPPGGRRPGDVQYRHQQGRPDPMASPTAGPGRLAEVIRLR